MLRSKAFTGSLAIVVFCCVISTAKAQTGPSGPITSGPSNPVVTQGGQMSPERLVSMLQKDGHQVELKKFQDGAPLVIATVTRDGWRFVVEFEFTKDLKTVFMQIPLGASQQSYSQAQLVALMKKSFEANPNHFVIRPGDGKLCLGAPAYNTMNLGEEFVRAVINNLVRVVRETHPLWSGSTAQAPATTPTAPTVTPTVTPTATPTSTVNLANTTWIGSENLKDFGRLEFRFLANGQVIMIDTAGQQSGTYTQNGNTITLNFYNNTVTYTGAITGQTIAGSATNGTDNWKFSVSR